MSKIRFLSDLTVGESGRIFKIEPCQCDRRLNELGFTPNSRIVVLHKNIGGSAYAYYIKGTVIALRKEESKNILVREDCYV